MKKFTLLFFITIICSAEIYSQWVWQSPEPMGLPVYSVESISPEVFFAAGSSGAILKSTDAGKNWQQLLSYQDSELLQIMFVDEKTVYALASDTYSYCPGMGVLVLLKSIDGGRTWIECFRGGDVFRWAAGFSFITPEQGALIHFGSIYLTSDGGSTWTHVSVSSSREYSDIFYTDKTTCYLAGQSGSIMKSTDGGLSWTEQVTPTNEHLYSISFTDSPAGYAVGAGGIILKTTDGGTAWSVKDSGVKTKLFSVHSVRDSISGSSLITAVGEDGIILRSTDNGSTWNIQTSTTNFPLYSVTFGSISNGMAAGEHTILRTSDGGITWIPIGGNQVIAPLYSVDFSDQENGMAVGKSGTIVKTTDGGDNWILQNSGTSKNLYDLFLVNNQIGYAAGENGTILKTTDGGTDWLDCSIGNIFQADQIRTIFFLDPLNGFAGGDGGVLYRTTDGGENWILKNLETRFITNIFSFKNNGWITAGHYVFTTSDGGDTWERSKYREYQRKYYFTDSYQGFSFGANQNFGSLSRTTDGGKTWNSVNLDQPQYLKDISFSDSYNGVLVGYGSYLCHRGEIYRTTDGGVTWNQEYSNKSMRFSAVSFKGGKAVAVGAMVGSSGGFILGLEPNSSGFTNAEVSFPKENSLLQNYPNPFNSGTVIEYSLPEQTHVTITVFDALGREITKLLDEEKTPGTYTIKFNASALSSGIYIYRIKAGRFSETRKMLLLR